MATTANLERNILEALLEKLDEMQEITREIRKDCHTCVELIEEGREDMEKEGMAVPTA